MDYNDLYFEKQGYKKILENERLVSYEKPDNGKSTVILLINESPNGPAYFHFSVEKYIESKDGRLGSMRIKDVEYEHLKNKAHSLMKKLIQPAIEREMTTVPQHAPMVGGIPHTIRK